MFSMVISDAFLLKEGGHERLVVVGQVDGSLKSGDQVCVQGAPELTFRVSTFMVRFGTHFDPRRVALSLVPTDLVAPGALVGKTLCCPG